MEWAEWGRQAEKAILFRGHLLERIMIFVSIKYRHSGSDSVSKASQALSPPGLWRAERDSREVVVVSPNPTFRPASDQLAIVHGNGIPQSGNSHLPTGILAGILAACVAKFRPQPTTKKKPQL
jgi:hypothetical protein